MMKIVQKIGVKKIAAVLAILAVMILSMSVFSKVASDPSNHEKTIEVLDEKKSDVLKLTAATAAASTALAAIPGDATTPVANKAGRPDIIFSGHPDGRLPGKVSGYTYRVCCIFRIDTGGMRPARGRDLPEQKSFKNTGGKNSGVCCCYLHDHPGQYEHFFNNRRYVQCEHGNNDPRSRGHNG